MTCRGRQFAALTIALIATTARATTQTPTFSAAARTVRVDVLVSSGNEPLKGLRPDDFELLDNGVPQRVELASFDTIPLNVILVLDVSDSVAGERFDQLQRASASLLAALSRQDQAALITFSDQVRRPAALSPDLAGVRQALEDASGTGRTALIDAVYAGITTGEGDAGRALVIVFSDGVDTASWLSREQLLDAAKRSDAVIYGVSVRSRVKPVLLEELSAATGGRLGEAEQNQGVPKAFLDVLNEFRNRYLIGYTPSGVTPDGWHRLEVRIKGRQANVRARPGYFAGS